MEIMNVIESQFSVQTLKRVLSIPFFKSAFLCAVVFFPAFYVNAQMEYVDTEFNGTGVQLTISVEYPKMIPYDMVIQPDQKSVEVCEGWTAADNDLLVIRHNADGTLDETFGSGGIASFDSEDRQERVVSLSLQSDGKIVVCGNLFVSLSDIQPLYWFVIRVNTDGTLDTSFGDAGWQLIGGVDFVPTKCHDSAVQSDDKILIVGETLTTDYDRGTVVRLNSDGTIDDSFGVNGVFFPHPQPIYNFLDGIAVQPDGMIIAYGSIYGPNIEYNDYLIIRFDQNGILDPSFGIDGISIVTAGTILYETLLYSAIQDDGKIILVGSYYGETFSGGYMTSLTRLNQDGTVDTNFADNGRALLDYNPLNEELPQGVVIRDNGKIAVAFNSQQFAPQNYALMLIKQFLPDGTPDADFGDEGLVQLDFGIGRPVSAIGLLENDKIVICGIGNNPLEGYHTMMLTRIFPSAVVNTSEYSDLRVEYSIFPNPMHEVATLSFSFEANQKITAVLYDCQGKLLRTLFTELSLPSGKHQHSLNVNDLSPGNYFIRVTNELHQNSVLDFIRE